MKFRASRDNGVNPTILVFGVILFWFIYTCTYLVLKNEPDTVLLSGYLSLIGETGLDIFLVGLTFRLWHVTKCSNNRKLFLIFFSAFIAAICADGIYNIVLNLYEFQYVNPVVILMFELPFSLFLFFQAMAWTYILYINRENSLKFNRTLYIPYLIVSTLMFAMFMFGVKWQVQYFSIKGMFQSIDTVLEVIGFSMATICFSRAQTSLIRFASIGYLLIIASDFIIRYHVVSGIVPYLSSLESTWILGLTLMSLGFFLVNNSNDEKLFRLSAVNSLQSLIGIWLLVLWLISVFMFAGTYFFFSPGTEPYLNHFTKHFLSMLVPFSVLAIISSTYISIKISSPLSRLESKINEFLLTEKTPEEITNLNDYGYISEFKALDKFVFDAFSLYQKKYFTDIKFAKLAAQVTHDIRSPLAAINTALFDVTSVPENKRIMIKNAANRINDIANNLLLQSKNDFFNSLDSNSEDSDSAELIFVILDSIVAEKQYEHYKTNINLNLNWSECSYNCFSRIHLSSFKRVLSNLINNSIEAVNSKGSIEITLNCNASQVAIIIQDNGCGIPPEILPKITEQGFSFNKMKGAGLGLSYAKQYLEQIKGKMHIHSEEKVGTKITIELIRAEHPSWFCDTLNISQNARIVVLDDDLSIHDVWDARLASNTNFTVSHCYNVLELNQYKIEPGIPILYLIDYELNNDVKNGLDIIEGLKINDMAILVTSCFEDPVIRKRCEKLGVKIIPKPYVPVISINCKDSIETETAIILAAEEFGLKSPNSANISFDNEKDVDLIIIDDNSCLTDAWVLHGERVGKQVKTFNNVATFKDEINRYKKNIPIYIDSDLGCKLSGQELAKEIYEQGFINLYLCTGFPADYFDEMYWIKDILGKEAPF